MMFSFGRDVNIRWKHGINALPKQQQNGKGRISIVLWGYAKNVIEELGNPPLLTNDARFGFDNTDQNKKQVEKEPQNADERVKKAFTML